MEYYLGSPSADGFVSGFFGKCEKRGAYTFVLKGGAGTGKSSLMKAIAMRYGEGCDVFHCASDPKSLDAVHIRDADVIVCDGTAPHTYDPKYPAVSGEIINLGEFWRQEEIAAHSDELLRLYAENAAYHRRARDYASAMRVIAGDISKISSEGLCTSKAEAAASRLCERILPVRRGGRGEIVYETVAALTPSGLRAFIPESYELYVLKDVNAEASGVFLKKLAEEIAERGCDAICGKSVVNGAMECVAVPTLEKMFICSSYILGVPFGKGRCVNMSRFYKKDALAARRQRLAFGKRIYRELYSEAVRALEAALTVHDEIEARYIPAMDFSETERVKQKICDFADSRMRGQ